MRVDIKNANKLQRDTSSMAVINTDRVGRQAALARRNALLEKDRELETMRSELTEIKAILAELLKDKNK